MTLIYSVTLSLCSFMRQTANSKMFSSDTKTDVEREKSCGCIFQHEFIYRRFQDDFPGAISRFTRMGEMSKRLNGWDLILHLLDLMVGIKLECKCLIDLMDGSP